MRRFLTPKHAAFVLVIIAAGATVWWFVTANERRVDAAYASCMKDIGSQADKAAADFAARQPAADPKAVAEAKGIGDAVTSMMQGIGGAICGAVRDTCRRDFDGSACQAALSRFK